MSSLRLQCSFIFKANTHTLILSSKPVQLNSGQSSVFSVRCALLSPACALSSQLHQPGAWHHGGLNITELRNHGVAGGTRSVLRPGLEAGVLLFLTLSLHNLVADHVMEPCFLPSPAGLPELLGS